jgi:hypothetical protein
MRALDIIRFAVRRRSATTITHIAVSILAGSLLIGCATPPPTPTSYSDLRLAALNAIDQAIEAEALFQTCAQFGGELGKMSDTARQQWLTNNWQSVVAADGFYRNELKSQIIHYKDETISIEALKLLAEAEKRANFRVKTIKRSRTNRTKVCNKRLNAYLNGERDLNWNNLVNKGMDEFARNHPAPPAPGARVPTLAGSLEPNSPPGRSLFKIERELAEQRCTQPLLFTFDNQWPTEMYGAFCGQTQYMYKCEWGDCKQVY